MIKISIVIFTKAEVCFRIFEGNFASFEISPDLAKRVKLARGFLGIENICLKSRVDKAFDPIRRCLVDPALILFHFQPQLPQKNFVPLFVADFASHFTLFSRKSTKQWTQRWPQLAASSIRSLTL